jgi:hypothetical protein
MVEDFKDDPAEMYVFSVLLPRDLSDPVCLPGVFEPPEDLEISDAPLRLETGLPVVSYGSSLPESSAGLRTNRSNGDR